MRYIEWDDELAEQAQNYTRYCPDNGSLINERNKTKFQSSQIGENFYKEVIQTFKPPFEMKQIIQAQEFNYTQLNIKNITYCYNITSSMWQNNNRTSPNNITAITIEIFRNQGSNLICSGICKMFNLYCVASQNNYDSNYDNRVNICRLINGQNNDSNGCQQSWQGQICSCSSIKEEEFNPFQNITSYNNIVNLIQNSTLENINYSLTTWKNQIQFFDQNNLSNTPQLNQMIYSDTLKIGCGLSYKEEYYDTLLYKITKYFVCQYYKLFSIGNNLFNYSFPCQIENCDVCFNNKSYCDKCKQGLDFNSKNLSCVINTTFSDGNNSFNQSFPCLIENCDVCSNNKTYCDKCKQNLYFDSTNLSCVINTTQNNSKLLQIGEQCQVINFQLQNCEEEKIIINIVEKKPNSFSIEFYFQNINQNVDKQSIQDLIIKQLVKNVVDMSKIDMQSAQIYQNQVFNTTFNITFAFEQPLQINQNIEFFLYEPNLDIKINNQFQQLKPFAKITEEEQKQVNLTKDLSKTGQLSQDIASTSLTALTLSSNGISSIMNLQLIEFLMFINVGYDERIKAIFTSNQPFPPVIIMKLLNMSELMAEQKIDQYQIPSQYSEYGVKAYIVNYNAEMYLFIGIILIPIVAILQLLDKFCFRKNQSKIFRFINNLFAWNLVYFLILIFYMQFCFSGFISLKYKNLNSNYGLINFIVGIIQTIFNILFIVHCYFTINTCNTIEKVGSKERRQLNQKQQQKIESKQNNNKKQQTIKGIQFAQNKNKKCNIINKIKNFYMPKDQQAQNDFLKKHYLIYGDFKCLKPIQRYTMLFDIARIFIISAIIVFLRNYPTIQIVTSLAIIISYFLFITIYLVNKDNLSIFQMILVEIFIIGAYATSLIQSIQENYTGITIENKKFYGKIISQSSLSIQYISSIGMTFMLIQLLFKQCLSFFNKKPSKLPLMNEQIENLIPLPQQQEKQVIIESKKIQNKILQSELKFQNKEEFEKEVENINNLDVVEKKKLKKSIYKEFITYVNEQLGSEIQKLDQENIEKLMDLNKKFENSLKQNPEKVLFNDFQQECLNEYFTQNSNQIKI